MPTYLNAYELVKQARMFLGEYSEDQLKGTRRSSISNEIILQALNYAQGIIYAEISFTPQKEILAAEATLTGADSVFTLPWNFGALIDFRDENRSRVYRIDHKERRHSESGGSDLLYYRSGNTLVVDKAGVSEDYTLYYLTKPRDLDFGISSAGGSGSITLAKSAKAVADYYNGLEIESVTGDWVDTISGYTSARIATISGTAAQNQFYGTVSELPEAFHGLIVPRAIIYLGGLPAIKTKFGVGDLQVWKSDLYDTLAAYSSSIHERGCPFDDDYMTPAAFWGLSVWNPNE